MFDWTEVRGTLQTEGAAGDCIEQFLEEGQSILKPKNDQKLAGQTSNTLLDLQGTNNSGPSVFKSESSLGDKGLNHHKAADLSSIRMKAWDDIHTDYQRKNSTYSDTMTPKTIRNFPKPSLRCGFDVRSLADLEVDENHRNGEMECYDDIHKWDLIDQSTEGSIDFSFAGLHSLEALDYAQDEYCQQNWSHWGHSGCQQNGMEHVIPDEKSNFEQVYSTKTMSALWSEYREELMYID